MLLLVNQESIQTSDGRNPLILTNIYRRKRISPIQRNVEMTAEVNESVQEEILDEASSQPESDQQHEAESQDQKPNSSDAEKNWAEARRKMKRLEEQNREMQEALEKIKKPKEEEPQDEDYDDLVTKGQVTQLAKKIAEDLIRKQEASTVEERLSLKHPDFSTVVSRENIETLKETEPELALSLAHISDPYKQGVAAYKMLKRLGIYQETESSPEKEKAIENSQKPRSVNTVSKNSAIGNAHLFENGLTPALKKQLWEEMQQARKRA